MLLLNLILTLVWMAMTGEFTPSNFFEGFILSYILVYVAQQLYSRPRYLGKGRKVVALIYDFLIELFIASFRVVRSVFQPRSKLNPGVVAIPLDLESDVEIMLLGHMITLTPGTLTLDVSHDKRVIYVHTIEIGESKEAFRRSIKEGFERRILEVTR